MRLFPCRVHFARAAGCTGPPEQARDVRSVVPSDRGNPAGDCSRSATPRGTDRLFLHLAHLGADSHSSSSSALCRAWRWHLPRWQSLGGLPSRLLLTRARTLGPLSKPLSPQPGGVLCDRENAVLRQVATVI